VNAPSENPPYKYFLVQLGRVFLYASVALLEACATPATSERMVSAPLELAKRHPQTVHVRVNGGQETEAVGRPHISDSAFTRALIESITRSRTFSKVIENQNEKADYLLTVTIFSLHKRVFGNTVNMEAGWTLRRTDNGAIVWQESIISEFASVGAQPTTEGAARNNIAQGLAKISTLNL